MRTDHTANPHLGYCVECGHYGKDCTGHVRAPSINLLVGVFGAELVLKACESYLDELKQGSSEAQVTDDICQNLRGRLRSVRRV